MLKRILKYLYCEISGAVSVVYYSSLAFRFRRVIPPVIKNQLFLLKGILILLFQLQYESYILSGKTKGSELKALYIGLKPGLSYVTHLVYNGEYRIKEDGKIYIWKIRKKIETLQTSVDLVIVETNSLYAHMTKKLGLLLIPQWIAFSMKTPDSLAELVKGCKKGLKNDIRKIHKYNFSYEISKEPEKLELFYHRMYVPYISKRHSELAHLHDFQSLRSLLKTGAIAFVKQNDDYIAGSLLAIRGQTLYAVCTGIKDGDISYLKKSVSSAVNYFIIKWAIEHKYKIVNFRFTRAFMNDGVFRFKRGWGMTLDNNKYMKTFFGLKACNFNEGVQNFLENNPFISYNNCRIEGFVFVKTSSPVGEGEIRYIHKHFWTDGLSRLNILSCSGFSDGLKDIIASEYPGINLVNKDFLFGGTDV